MPQGRSRKRPPQEAIFATWGGNVRRRRELLGLRQSDLAEISGIPQQTISRVESGVTQASVRLLLKLSVALHAESGELFPWPTYLDVTGSAAPSGITVIGKAS